MNKAVSAENEVPAGEIRLFDSQWSNIVNGETTVEGAVKATEKAMRRNFEDGAFPPPRAFFTKTITDLQSSLVEKDETIAELRARCEAAEKMVGVARTFFNSVYFAGGGGSGLCAAFDAYDAEIAAQHRSGRRKSREHRRSKEGRQRIFQRQITQRISYTRWLGRFARRYRVDDRMPTAC